MSPRQVRRRLAETTTRMRSLREELRISHEQLEHLADTAHDARLRALVSETPVAEREVRDADRHVEAMQRHCSDLQAEIHRLEALQDQLLDRLTAESS